MSKLLKNEFKKLFSKKLMYVLFIISIAFIILTSILNHMDSPYDAKEELNKELSYLDEELKTIDYKLPENNEYYIDLKTQYDLIKLKLNYDSESWQYNFSNTNTYLNDVITEINRNTYGIDKNNVKLKEAQEQYNVIKEKMDLGNWKSFVEKQLESTKEDIFIYEQQIKSIKDKKALEEINNALEMSKVDKQILEWRLEKDIPYNNSFLSSKIEEYNSNYETVISLKNKENKTKEEKVAYNEAIKIVNVNKYYIENNINIKNEYDARYMLINLAKEYGIFITIFTIIIAGIIVSNEFQKGTIKLLLTRPFSRGKILFAKYIVSILSIFMFIILFAISQYIIGGIISGFDVFNVPVVEYDFNTNQIVIMSIFKYLLITIITKLPIYILSATLAFALGTITMNPSISIAIPILGNMVSELFNLFIEKVKLLKYFVTANWDLSVYLFGGEGIAEGLTLSKSIIICTIYLVVMISTTYIIFKKRDIKNI